MQIKVSPRKAKRFMAIHADTISPNPKGVFGQLKLADLKQSAQPKVECPSVTWAIKLNWAI